MDIVVSKALVWAESGVGSVPCRECRSTLGQMRDQGHMLTLHEDRAGGVHLEIRPKVPQGLEKTIARHREHLIATLIMISIPQTFRVERAHRSLDGAWHWETVEERQASYAEAGPGWDALL